MKKFLVTLFVLMSVALLAEETGKEKKVPTMFFHFKLGGDFANAYPSVDNEKTSGLGYEFDFQMYNYWSEPFSQVKGFMFGSGFAVQVQPNKFEFNGKKVGTIVPFVAYVVGRNVFNIDGDWRPFYETHVGFNIVEGQGNDEYQLRSGAYVGIGLGVEYKNLTFDVMYKYNQQFLRPNGTDLYQNISYSRGVASIGYRF